MLIDNIKKDQLLARKSKDQKTSSLLTTLIGEAEKIGKDKGNRKTTDEEVIAVIKKFIKNLNETLGAVLQRSNSSNIINNTTNEIKKLEEYLPKQLTEQELTKLVSEFVSTLTNKSPKQMGMVMKHLKNNHNGCFDGKTASQIVKQQLG